MSVSNRNADTAAVYLTLDTHMLPNPAIVWERLVTFHPTIHPTTLLNIMQTYADLRADQGYLFPTPWLAWIKEERHRQFAALQGVFEMIARLSLTYSPRRSS